MATALLQANYMRPVKALGMSSIPIMSVVKAASIAFGIGTPIVMASGLATAAAADCSGETIAGIAVEAATSPNTYVLMCPALDNIIFKGQVAGASGVTATVVQASHVMLAHANCFDLGLKSSKYYINIASTSDDIFTITKLLEAASTAWAMVEFMFIDSYFMK